MNALEKFLKTSTPDERLIVATHAGTTVNYLYQIASGERAPSVSIAVGIEQGTRAVRTHRRKAQLVSCEDLAAIKRK